MNPEDLGNVGEFVAAIATIATLIYLAIQIRQNTAAVRSSTHQQQVDTTFAIHTNVSNDPDLAKLITKANSNFSSLDDSQQLQLLYFYTNYFNMWHFQYTNMRKGLSTKTRGEYGTRVGLSYYRVKWACAKLGR